MKVMLVNRFGQATAHTKLNNVHLCRTESFIEKTELGLKLFCVCSVKRKLEPKMIDSCSISTC